MNDHPMTGRVRLAALLALCALALGGCGVGEGATVGSGATLAQEASGPPTLALAKDGKTAYVAWLERGDSTADVVLEAVTPAGRRLRAPVRVNATPGDASTHDQAPPQVAVGPGGEVYVVWQKSTEVPGRMYPVSDLRFAYSTDGGRTFSPTMTVNDDAGGRPSSHSFHDLTVAPDGTVYVAWLDGRAQDSARAAHPAPPHPAAAAGSPHGAMSGMAGIAGMHGAHAHDASEPGAEIRVASWRPGDASFGPSVRVDGDVCPCCRVSLATGPDGGVYVAWRKVYPGEVREVVVARSADGGRSFSAPVRVQRDGWVFPGCPHAGPSLAVDGEGRLFSTWYSGKEGGQGLYYAVSSDGGRSFGDPVTLVAGDFVPASQARLAAGADGAVWAAWDDMRGEEKRIHVGRLDGSSVREVGDPLAGSTPSIRMSGGGGAVVWRDGQAVRIRPITTAG
jgi:hypothetical protein